MSFLGSPSLTSFGLPDFPLPAPDAPWKDLFALGIVKFLWSKPSLQVEDCDLSREASARWPIPFSDVLNGPEMQFPSIEPVAPYQMEYAESTDANESVHPSSHPSTPSAQSTTSPSPQKSSQSHHKSTTQKSSQSRHKSNPKPPAGVSDKTWQRKLRNRASAQASREKRNQYFADLVVLNSKLQQKHDDLVKQIGEMQARCLCKPPSSASSLQMF